jgi:hypothetical protein
MATEITAKGDLIVGTGSGTFDNLPAGTNGFTLVADSVEATGLKWVAPASGGGMTLLDTLSLSGSSTTSATISSAFEKFTIYLKGIYGSINQGMFIRFNADTASNYSYVFRRISDTADEDISASATYCRIGNYSTSSAAKETSNQIITLMRPKDTDQVFLTTSAQYYNVNLQEFQCSGVYDNSAAITSVTIGTIGGTMTAGTAYIYGVK